MSEKATAKAANKRFFDRTGLRPGLQLYTLGDEAWSDLDATFAEVAKIGYAEVELPSLNGRDPAGIRAAADRAGLKIPSLHLFAMGGAMAQKLGLTLLSDPSRIADALGALGAHYLVMPIPLLPGDMHREGAEDDSTMVSRTTVAGGVDIWKRTAALLNEKAAALKALGVELNYHNHNLKFAPIGGTTGWEILTRETDPGLVRFEIDVAFVVAAGLDPVPFVGGLSGRVSQAHVKDLKSSTVRNFALRGDWTEVGFGDIPWVQVLPAAYAAGARHFYVEQEAPFALPRLDAVRRSYVFLSQLEA